MRAPPLHLIGSFIAFADARNMTDAAATLGLSQPALSSHLKNFEACFEQRVFTMEGRKKTLTPFGTLLHKNLKERLLNLDQVIKAASDAFATPENVELRVAGRAEVLSHFAPRLRFEGSIVFIAMDGAAATRSLLERNVELALSANVPDHALLHSKRLFQDQFHLVVPAKWKLESKQLSRANLQFLTGQPFLSYKRENEPLSAILNHFGLSSLPKFARILGDWRSLISMVEAGGGWTVAPNRFHSAPETTVTIRVPASIVPPTDFHVLYRKESLSLPWFRTFLDEVLTSANA